MTTPKKSTRKTKAVEQTIDHDGHDIEEVVKEVVVEKIVPQVYQCTVFTKRGGPHEPLDVIGHVEYSDSTGLIRVVPNPKYDSDLVNFADAGIIVKGNPDAFFSPKTKGWIMNLHKAQLPRNWSIEEARSMNEV